MLAFPDCHCSIINSRLIISMHTQIYLAIGHELFGRSHGLSQHIYSTKRTNYITNFII